MPHLFVVGTASQDTLHLADGSTQHTIGGAGLYTALAAAAAGAQVTLFAPRPDPWPNLFEAAAARIAWIGPRITPEALPRLEIAHHGGGKATLIHAAWGAEAELLPEQLPPSLADVDFVHIAALSSAARQLMFLNACRARAAQRVSAGTYARSITQDRDTVTALLNTADTFFMNDNEASLLFGSVSSAVTRANALLFVTLGAAGALAIEGNHHLRVAAPATQDLDPTGAGDTFCGTVLAHLLDGANVIDACSAACRAASRMIAQPGPAALLA